MGQHREAAEHLLGALSVQTGNIESVLAQTKGKGRADESEFAAMHSVQSQTVWSTLKMVADGHCKLILGLTVSLTILIQFPSFVSGPP